MAIYHLSAKVIARSSGRSATAAAAYRAGERICDKHFLKPCCQVHFVQSRLRVTSQAKPILKLSMITSLH